MLRWGLWIRFIADCLVIPCAVVGGYILKFKLGWVARHFFYLSWGNVYQKAQIEPYLSVLWIVILVWIFSLALSGVYRLYRGIMPEVEELFALVKGVTLATIQVMALMLIYKPFPESRYVIVYAWILGILGMSFTRLIIHRYEKNRFKKGLDLKKAIVIGSDSVGQDIAESIITVPTLGYYYMGTFSNTIPDYIHFHLRTALNHLGSTAEALAYLQHHSIDAVFYTSQVQNEVFDTLYAWCENKGIEFNTIVFQTSPVLSLGTIEDFDTQTIIQERGPFPSRHFFLKYSFDFFVATLSLVALAPLFVIVAVMIKWHSPDGPVFYTQERVGLNNKPFNMIKFRTMIPNAESHSGPVMVSETCENRYITCGDFLRKTSIDELPQLINILKGEMSLVGPRPERAFFIQKFKETLPHFEFRHRMKPGLTGWAQINGRSVLTSRPDHKLRYDLFYIKNWTFLLDIKILLKTILVVFKREEAY